MSTWIIAGGLFSLMAWIVVRSVKKNAAGRMLRRLRRVHTMYEGNELPQGSAIIF